MIRGWGRCPSHLSKLGWFSCALLLEKSVHLNKQYIFIKHRLKMMNVRLTSILKYRLSISHIYMHAVGMEKPFFSFVGEKCCNTTILYPQKFKNVGVGPTFHSFVGPTVFVSQQMKTVGVGGNYAQLALLLFLQILALKSVGGTFSLLLDQQFQSSTYKTVLFRKVAPTVLRARNCRSNKREKSSQQ